MKLTIFKIIFFSILMTLVFSSCDKDDPTPEHPQELITTMRLTFTPSLGGDVVIFEFYDPDGDGGVDPIIQGGTLEDSTDYNLAIMLLDESVTPAEDITAEIEEEGTDHQFFFATTQDFNLTFAYLDEDENENPIGLETIIDTGPPATGQFQVTLRHGLNKNALGVRLGDITNAGGETDIEVAFDLVLQ